MDRQQLLLAVLLAVLIGGGYAWWQNEQRQRLQRMEELDRAAHPAKSPAHAKEANPPLYKWKDDKGQWHITDQPPAAGVPFEKVSVNPDTNVVPAVPPR